MKIKETKITSASVKVMQSYNYNHFEASMSLNNEDGIPVSDIDNARKECQRLTDKAIKQYQIAKDVASKNYNITSDYQYLQRQVDRIKQTPESEWNPEQKAVVKRLEDTNYESRIRRYDYDDDFDINDDYVYEEDDDLPY